MECSRQPFRYVLVALLTNFLSSIKTVSFLLLTIFSVGAFAQGATNNQPYSSYWFPNELLQWEAREDPHAKFNKSNVPLSPRFIEHGKKVDKGTSIPGITSLIAPHPTSNHPSQGFNSVEQYAFPFWSYLDYFVQWGGSSAEGLIISPALPWIESAHKNGVKVLGTVFFPPNVYGGKEEWVRDFLQKSDNGSFPVADKLIEVATYYGFEGWFINQETNGLNRQDADGMREFMKYYQRKGNGEYELMWYDAMIEDGRVIWQEELNDHNDIFFQEGNQKVSDIMFLDFGWNAVNLEDTKKAAMNLGRSAWDIYAGIDVQSRGYQSYANWKALYGSGKELKNTSIALYWSNSTFDLSESKKPESVYLNEQLFWNGTDNSDAKHPRIRRWEGFTNYIPPRSTINEYPFVSHFNYGLGYIFNISGETVTNSEWHNLSIQDILPHWQWQVDTTEVKPTFHFRESYEGGSSLVFDIRQPSHQATSVPLYKMDLIVERQSRIKIASKGSNKAPVLMALELNDGSIENFAIPPSSNWQSKSFSLASLAGKTIQQLNVVFNEQNAKSEFFLGEIILLDEPQKRLGKSELSLRTFGNGEEVEAYLDIKSMEEVWYHDIFQKQSDGSKKWLKRSASTSVYLSNIKVGNKAKNELVVIPIGFDGGMGRSASVKFKE